MHNLRSFEELVEAFSRLPSVGKKSAERMAYAVLAMPQNDVENFANALLTANKKIHQCPNCGLYTENEICDICSDKERDHSTVIVLSHPKDYFNFEKLNTYRGVYHVLNGTINVIKGIGAEDLNIDPLMKKINNNEIKEIIIATDPTFDGETTALYIAKLLINKNVNVTRLAYGLPMGGHIDYADTLTIAKALEGRKKL